MVLPPPPAQRRCAGVFLIKDGEVLLARRSPDREWYPNVWDIVGGHCEQGEDAVATARRELVEELGVSVSVDDLAYVDTFETAEYQLTVFAATRWQGEPRNIALDEHAELGWFTPSAAADLDLADPQIANLVVRAVETYGGE